MRHVDHRLPSAGTKDASEFLQDSRKVCFWKKIEHVVVDQDIEAVVRKWQVVGVAELQTVSVIPRMRGSPLCAPQHRRSQVDTFVVTRRIGFENLCERQTGSNGYFKNIFTVLYVRQFQAAFSSLSFCQPGPRVVKRGNPGVDTGNLFLPDLGVKHVWVGTGSW